MKFKNCVCRPRCHFSFYTRHPPFLLSIAIDCIVGVQDGTHADVDETANSETFSIGDHNHHCRARHLHHHIPFPRPLNPLNLRPCNPPPQHLCLQVGGFVNML